MTAASVPADPLRGFVPAITTLRSRADQTSTAVRALGSRIKNAASGADLVRTAVAQAATATRGIKTTADTTTRSLTRTARSATTAAPGIKSVGANAKRSTTALGKLGSALGGVFAMVGALISASSVLGDLMGTFGTAVTIGSGVMLVINALTRANPIGFVTGLLLPVAGWLIDLAVNSETGQRLIEQLATLILQYVEGYLTLMTPLLKAVASAVNTYVTGYLDVITTALTAIGALVGTGFAVLRALTTGDTRALSGKVSSIWRGFKDRVKPILTWITKDVPRMFTRIKDATSRTLRAIGQFMTTGTQTVAGVVKGPIQGLIAFANWVIDGLNHLSFNFLGKKFGVHLSKIPQLAEGGVVHPAAVPGAATVKPLTSLGRYLPAPSRSVTTTGPASLAGRPKVRVYEERAGSSPMTVAEDLLFLRRAA
jgi:phage-related protein